MTLITPDPKLEIEYPDCDGNPMSDNTKQFRWIVTIKENLEILFADNPQVFVAGDLLWYPVEGDNTTRSAPDAMVIFGRPKGDRGSYMQWRESQIAPQVVFEILSPGNTKREMDRKRSFYETYGVEEYYVYDPDDLRKAQARGLRFEGWQRSNGRLVAIEEMEGWVSPRLQIRFVDVTGAKTGELEIYRPDGRKFLTPVELEAEMRQAQAQAQQAQAQAQQAQAQAQQAQAQVQTILINLLQAGLPIEQVAQISNCSIEQVTTIQQTLTKPQPE